MADILNSIIHSSDNAIGGLYNAMNIRRQREQDNRAIEQNAYTRSRDQQGDKQYYFEQAAKIVGGRPENVQQGLDYLAMNGPPPDPRVGEMLVSYGQSMREDGRGGGIGQYNPRDYTPETWAKFVQTGDPAGLARYEPFSTTMVGDVPMPFNRVTGQLMPGTSISNGIQTPIDANYVANNASTVAGAVADAKNASDTRTITDQAPLLADAAFQRVASEEQARTDALQTGAPVVASAAAQKVTAEEQARSKEAKRVGFPKVKAAMIAEKANHDMVQDSIREAVKLSSKAAGMSALTSVFPESDARELAGLLDTIKANIGFNKLGEMRANAPSGASGLGNLTKEEFENLVSLAGKLDQKGKPATLVRNLNHLLGMREAAWLTLDSAYQSDYEEYLNPSKPANGTPDDIQQLMDKYAPK